MLIKLKDIRSDFVNLLKFDPVDFDREYAAWVSAHGEAKEAQFSFFWVCIEHGMKHYNENAKDDLDRYQNLRNVYQVMFSLLIAEGKSVTPAIKGMNEMDILKANEAKFEMEGEIIAGNRCNHARLIDGGRFRLQDALVKSPIDYDKCDRDGGCVCVVGFEGIRDETGSLKKKV